MLPERKDLTRGDHAAIQARRRKTQVLDFSALIPSLCRAWICPESRGRGSNSPLFGSVPALGKSVNPVSGILNPSLNLEDCGLALEDGVAKPGRRVEGRLGHLLVRLPELVAEVYQTEILRAGPLKFRRGAGLLIRLGRGARDCSLGPGQDG